MSTECLDTVVQIKADTLRAVPFKDEAQTALFKDPVPTAL